MSEHGSDSSRAHFLGIHMIIYHTTHTNPYFNLASEQYLMDRNPTEPIFMLWRNEASVIIGKNQNAYAELDTEFVREKGIKVVRRLTGGGAVFHDLGNVNYTFIVPERKEIDFARFTEPVIAALRKLGMEAALSGRNDITVDGMKVSGNAACVYNGCTMHHGTLLFSADLSNLAGALKPNPAKIRSKGIGSVRSRVTNISEHLPTPMTAEVFLAFIESYASVRYGVTPISFTEAECAEIAALAESRYSRWEWNFGMSKAFEAVYTHYFEFGTVEASVTLEQGMIKALSIGGDFFGTRDITELAESLIGIRCDSDSITAALEALQMPLSDYILGATPREIASLICGELT